MGIEQPEIVTEKPTEGDESRCYQPLSSAAGNFLPRSGGRYVRLELHDQGGMGRVWVARDIGLDRDVALKELRPELADNPSLLARFLREARITGQLEHPGVVPVYELARSDDPPQPFYTMRFVRGRTLTQASLEYHQKRAAGADASLDLAVLLQAFVMVCNTVGFAHSRGVIHRDLKGQNVILGDFGEVVVLDWGVAKLMERRDNPEAGPDTPGTDSDDASLTRPGQALGTPACMAPEQASGRFDRIDHRTDIYGLGAILYEVLTGQPPFSGSSAREVLRKVQEEHPAPPRHICPEVPPGLERVCLRALAKNPEDRYAATKEMAEAVQQWQEAERREAEEALRSSEERYRLLADAIPQIVWTTGLDGSNEYLNQRWFEYTGSTPDQSSGYGWMGALHPDDRARTTEEWARARDHAESFEAEYRLRRADGSYRWHLVLAMPLRDGSGRIAKWFGTCTDIDDRKRAEQERAASLG
jgi:PAS domain S-box-containing protein